MKFNELTVSKQRKPNRVGRGISAGRGKTAGRGTKGQGARKSTVRAGFEGGQMPLYMRLPKLRGFKSKRPVVENVYTGQLSVVKGATVDANTLAEAGLISNPYVNIKLVTKGELTTKKTVKLPSASKSAIEMIEKAGGSFQRTERLARIKKTDTK
jgi:large subunit ribosomal protein L15